MTTQHIETLIIGAGQAGLSTGYHLQRRGRPFLIVDGAERVGDNWRQQWDTLRLYTPAKYDGLPGLPFPADDPWHFPGKDEVAAYLEQYALHFDLPVRMSTRIDRLQAASRRRLRRHHRRGHDHLRQRRGGHRHVRPDPVGPGLRRRPRPRHQAAALQRVPPPRPARPGHRPRRRRLALRHGHRLRGRARPATRSSCGRDCGQIPVPPRVPAGARGAPGDRLHVPARAHPAYADGPQGDARGALPRRARACASSGTTWRAAASSGSTSRVVGVMDGMPLLDDGRVVDARDGRVVHRLPAGFDWIDLPSSATTAGRWSTAAWSTTRPGCSSAG